MSARFGSLLAPLLTGLAVVTLFLLFAKLGGEVVEGDTRSFDVYLLRGAQTLRVAHPWLVRVMQDLSALGSTTVLTLFTIVSVVYLALVTAGTTAVLVATAIISGSTVISITKAAFGRLRPEQAFAEMVVPGLSFPSGHAGMSAIVCLTLGALVANSRILVIERLYILAAAALLALLVGLSRIALGVHWATDVLAGWAFGAGWALLWLLVARRLADRRALRLGHTD